MGYLPLSIEIEIGKLVFALHAFAVTPLTRASGNLVLYFQLDAPFSDSLGQGQVVT